MISRLLALVLTLAALACLSACGGIKSRIKDNQRQFDTYPPEVQAQIQNGRIDRGFTEEMVFMAKGEPAEKTKVTRNGHPLTVWKYSRPTPPAPPGSPASNLSTPYGYPGFGPGPSQPAPLFYDRSYFNVEFENGKVIDWDSEMQSDFYPEGRDLDLGKDQPAKK